MCSFRGELLICDEKVIAEVLGTDNPRSYGREAH
jgi:hypothetical protein